MITSSADVVTLYVDKIIEVGILTVVVDGSNLVVTYNSTDPWVLKETHLYDVGTATQSRVPLGKVPLCN